MDEFAQTRSPDDLFDDEVTPISDPTAESLKQPRESQPNRGRNDRFRGRGKGRGASQISQNTKSPQQSTKVTSGSPDLSESLPSEVETPLKPPSAVRGDRSATGGNAKPKLTEDELSARLAAAKLNNAKREEAHRLAEADEASFQQREAQASQRRQEEGRAKRLMDQEREKNRLRKLGAQGGREWDEGKEEQPVDTRRSQYQRGAHGATGQRRGGDRDGEAFANENNGFDRGSKSPGFRGRGNRGRGRGGRGHQGYGGEGHGTSNPNVLRPPAPEAENEFPALPRTQPEKKTANSNIAATHSKNQRAIDVPTFQSSTDNGQSWADEVNVRAATGTPAGGW